MYFNGINILEVELVSRHACMPNSERVASIWEKLILKSGISNEFAKAESSSPLFFSQRNGGEIGRKRKVARLASSYLVASFHIYLKYSSTSFIANNI